MNTAELYKQYRIYPDKQRFNPSFHQLIIDQAKRAADIEDPEKVLDEIAVILHELPQPDRNFATREFWLWYGAYTGQEELIKESIEQYTHDDSKDDYAEFCEYQKKYHEQ